MQEALKAPLTTEEGTTNRPTDRTTKGLSSVGEARAIVTALALFIAPAVVTTFTLIAFALLTYSYYLLTPDNVQSAAGAARLAEGPLPRVAFATLVAGASLAITFYTRPRGLVSGGVTGALSAIYLHAMIYLFFPPLFVIGFVVDLGLGTAAGLAGALASSTLHARTERSDQRLLEVMAAIDQADADETIAKAFCNLLDNDKLVGVALWRDVSSFTLPDAAWASESHFSSRRESFDPLDLVSEDYVVHQKARKKQNVASVYSAPLLDLAGRKSGLLLLAFCETQFVTPGLRGRLQRASIGALTTLNLRKVSRELLEEREITVKHRERKNVAATIHETTVQNTVAVPKHLEALKTYLDAGDWPAANRQLNEAYESANEAHSQARHLMNQLADISTRDEIDLPHRLRQTEADLKRELVHGRSISFDEDLDPQINELEDSLDAEEVHALHTIMREALRNAVKHATKAQTISYYGTVKAGHLELAVVDDGGGFDPTHVPDEPSRDSGLGMHIMREKAEELQATIAIDPAFRNADGSTGTKVMVRMTI